uniref:NADH dehydrogenase subunit 2 n=2 Tax=Rhinebothrium TaxID=108287 RepID=A0A8K1SY28_9CEST|nr:NADH dehydrogenase subunit 2 [Rhinebothrium sp. LRP 10405]UFQ88416.1 NADH dehydrogenase subunit 2 [Rhinebothrium taeniuri]
MSTSRLHIDLVFFSFFFSVVFCLFCCLVDNIMGLWVFMELMGMAIVPSFFYSNNSSISSFYNALLSYVVISGISSVLIMSGILFSGLYYLLLLGFVVKLGFFPFSFWLYAVFGGSNWAFIFFLSVVSKFPVLFFCFLLQNTVEGVLYWDCFFTLVCCSMFFWLLSNSWEFVWCHISLSSVTTLVVACFCSEPLASFYIFFYYSIWATVTIAYFYFISSWQGNKYSFWVYCFLLLVTPLSLPIFYKLGVCLALLYSSVSVLLSWCLYSFSEQMYLYKVGSDCFYSSVSNSWL